MDLQLQHLNFRLKTRLMQITELHLKEEYDKNGRPKESNIDIKERKSITAARELEEEGETIVRPADKANASVLDTKLNYKELMEKHLKDDPVISEKEKERCVREYNGHAAAGRYVW